MHPVPLHRVSILKGFADYLSEVGTPIEKALGSAGLPASALDDINLFIPSHRFRQFVVDSALKEGVDCFGFRVGRRFGALCMRPGMNAALQLQPTLYKGLLYAGNYCARHGQALLQAKRISRFVPVCRLSKSHSVPTLPDASAQRKDSGIRPAC